MLWSFNVNTPVTNRTLHPVLMFFQTFDVCSAVLIGCVLNVMAVQSLDFYPQRTA